MRCWRMDFFILLEKKCTNTYVVQGVSKPQEKVNVSLTRRAWESLGLIQFGMSTLFGYTDPCFAGLRIGRAHFVGRTHFGRV